MAFVALAISGVWIVFYNLGSAPLWKPEGRIAEVVREMFIRDDFFHPTSGWLPHVTKPLLPYWMVAFVAKLHGVLDEWAVRMPSAIGGLMALIATGFLGARLISPWTGIIASGLLLSCYGFVLWARCGAQDMLSLAGITAAVAWYWWWKNRPKMLHVMTFGVILALAAQMKGLVGLAVPGIVILPDLILSKAYKRLLKPTLLIALFLGLSVYVIPFLISSLSADTHGFNWLSRAIHESVIRFLRPFDHRGSVWMYVKFLPIWLIPWTPLFFFAVFDYLKHFFQLDYNRRWLSLSIVIIFCFFTASGSRRSYYILPILPLCTLLIADFIMKSVMALINSRARAIEKIALIGQSSFLLIISVLFLLFEPASNIFFPDIGLPEVFYKAICLTGLTVFFSSILSLWFFIKRKDNRPFWATCFLLVSGFLAMSGVFCLGKPALDQTGTERQFMLDIKKWIVSHPDTIVAYYLVGARPRTRLSFYLDQDKPVTVLRNDNDLEKFILSSSKWLIICVKEDEDGFNEALQLLNVRAQMLFEERLLKWEGYPKDRELKRRKKYVAYIPSED